MVGGCNEIDLTDENALIVRSTHNCLPLKPEREVRATVIFKMRHLSKSDEVVLGQFPL
jgi:hypothetical protein